MYFALAIAVDNLNYTTGIHWRIASSEENLSFGQRGKKGALPNGGLIPD